MKFERLLLSAIMAVALFCFGAAGSVGASTPVLSDTVSVHVAKAKAAKKVYIAPNNGTKYHYNKHCRGLKNARSVKKITLSKAKKQGYKLCGWEK